MCCMRLDANTGRKKSTKICHLGTIAQLCRAISLQLRHVSTIKKKLVKQQYLLHISPQYGELWPMSGRDRSGSIMGTPANFNGFRILAVLLQRRRSTEANQTLHGVWPSPGLVHDIYIFGGSCPITEFCQVQNSLCVQVLCSRILAVLLHGTPAAGVSQTLRCWAQGATLLVAGPSVWNSLPAVIRHITDISAFKRHLKTYLFNLYFNT